MNVTAAPTRILVLCTGNRCDGFMQGSRIRRR